MRALAVAVLVIGCSSSSSESPADAGPVWQDGDICSGGFIAVTCSSGVAGRACASAITAASCIDGGVVCPPGMIPRTECGCFVDGGGAPGDLCPSTDAGTDAADVGTDAADVGTEMTDVAGDASDAACVPPTSTCASFHTEAFPFDPVAKCRRCASEEICAADGCGAAPSCIVKIATGELHYLFYACGAHLADAGFRACTADEQKTMGATWPPPPMCP